MNQSGRGGCGSIPLALTPRATNLKWINAVIHKGRLRRGGVEGLIKGTAKPHILLHNERSIKKIVERPSI
jgi:hypothetical protein